MALSSSISYADINQREEKSHGSLFLPVACYCVHFPESTIPLHWHDELEFIIVSKGRLQILFGTEKLVLNQGEGIFINANVIHSAEAVPGIRTMILTIVFHPRLIAEANTQSIWKTYINPLINNPQLPVLKLTEEIPWQKSILAGIYQSWEILAYDKFGYELRVRNALSEVILTLIENHQGQSFPECQKDRRNNERLKEILMYIHSHYYEPISLEDIVNVMAMSRSSCLRFFKNTLGMTPLNYVTQYRLMAAAQYLEGTDWLVSEIGYRCGFSDMGYFSGQFKKKFGVTPREYRMAFDR
ncbi:AraC family transcriptional regulator [Spirochaeta cellobiosiphila]|uniref:AraC family transcriptional regulator n=1 Tax=Spirochaeta cellobiosiphila TaxID=504483 RepID=UPI0004051C5E|nr:AraC family transcriptional regulator [Spirochaeta cellobiosiphila]